MEGDNGRPGMNSRAITAVLIVLVIVGVVYSVINILLIQRELVRLELDHAQLQTTYNSLERVYWTVQDKYQSLQSTYSTLKDNYQSMENDYQTLQSTFTELQAIYNQLQDENAGLATLLWELQVDNAQLQRLLEAYEQVPNDYYHSGTFAYHSNTYAELCDFLDYEFGPIPSYDPDTFDCSESSAYLEWALENAGFDAQIAAGPAPWDQSSGHAWVIVNTETQQVAIEATALTGWDKFFNIFLGRTPGIIYTDDWLFPYWQNYYDGYDSLFQNIYDAVRHWRSIDQWNWWDVI